MLTARAKLAKGALGPLAARCAAAPGPGVRLSGGEGNVTRSSRDRAGGQGGTVCDVGVKRVAGRFWNGMKYICAIRAACVVEMNFRGVKFVCFFVVVVKCIKTD